MLSARNDLATNHVSLGELGEAERIFAELLPRLIEARGPRHRIVGTLRVNLGALAHNQGHAEEAVAQYERALEFYAGDDDTAGAESVRFRLGVLHLEHDRLEPAAAALRRALEDRARRLGPEHADLAEILDGLAEVERQQGQLESARERARRAVQLLEGAHGPDYLDLRAPLVTIGKLEIDRGRHAQAEAVLRRAHALVYAAEVDGIVRGEVCFDLARATIDDPAEHERALELAREAARLFGEAGERAADLHEEVDAWLREAGQARGG